MLQLQANAEEEYAKNEDLKKDDVHKLMKWAKGGAKCPNLNEFEAVLFLQSCHGDLQRAKKSIEVFYEVKKNNPKIFLERNPFSAQMRRAIKTNLIAPLPKLTKEGYQIILVKVIDSDPANFVHADCIKLLDMVTMLLLHQKGTNKGFITIVDQNNFSLRHLMKINVGVLRTSLYYVQEGLPIRLKGVHFFNAHSLMDKIFALMRPFVKKDLMEMLKAHTDIETLYEYVPKDCLPVDYGGTCSTLSELFEEQKKTLMNNGTFFEEEEKNLLGDHSGLVVTECGNNKLGVMRRTLQTFGF